MGVRILFIEDLSTRYSQITSTACESQDLGINTTAFPRNATFFSQAKTTTDRQYPLLQQIQT